MMYLSRLKLSKDPSVAALSALIDPKERARAMDAHHRLVWSAFAGNPDRDRDFLWRHDGKDVFYVLSSSLPSKTPFFDKVETKPFSPALQAGDRLAFTLRVNATRSAPFDPKDLAPNGRHRRRKTDIVMHALKDTRDRATQRMPLARQEAERWMHSQGRAKGFALENLDVEDYSVMSLPGHTGRRKGQPQFGILDLTGILSVEDPDAFRAALNTGFGRAKAFGCGLMLVRRA